MNPYTPPDAKVEDPIVVRDVVAQALRRPIPVWLISGFLVIAVIAGNAYFLVHLLGYGSNAAYAAGLADLTAFDYGRRVVGATLSLAAAISLFLMKKIAIVLFLVLLILIAVFAAYALAIGSMPLRATVGLVGPALLYWYAAHLGRQGRLK